MGLLAPVGATLLAGIAGQAFGGGGRLRSTTNTDPMVTAFMRDYIGRTGRGLRGGGEGFYAPISGFQRNVLGGAERSLNALNPTDFYTGSVLPALRTALEGDLTGMTAIQDLFTKNRGLALTQAKESAGSLGSVAGTGLARGIGDVVNESLTEENVTLGDLYQRNLDRRLSAAGMSGDILSGLPDIFARYYGLGEAERQARDTGLARAHGAAMGLAGPAAQPQPLGYEPGFLETLAPAFASLYASYANRPGGRGRSPASSSRPNINWPNYGWGER